MLFGTRTKNNARRLAQIWNLKCDSETKELKFFDTENIPDDIMDFDLIEAYLKSI